MKTALAFFAVIVGLLWGLVVLLLIVDWFGCDWGGNECGPEDGWATLIFGPFVAMAGLVVVPAALFSVVYLLRQDRRE